jgi:hypothetical protein
MTDQYRPHPDDEWVKVAKPGETEPEYVLAQSGGAAEVAKARAQYLAGQITIEQFEIVLHRLMR